MGCVATRLSFDYSIKFLAPRLVDGLLRISRALFATVLLFCAAGVSAAEPPYQWEMLNVGGASSPSNGCAVHVPLRTFRAATPQEVVDLWATTQTAVWYENAQPKIAQFPTFLQDCLQGRPYISEQEPGFFFGFNNGLRARYRSGYFASGYYYAGGVTPVCLFAPGLAGYDTAGSNLYSATGDSSQVCKTGYYLLVPEPPTLPPPDTGANSCPVEGNPINPANGNKYQSEIDYNGRSESGLSISRSYSSLSGSGWRFSHHARLREIYKPGHVYQPQAQSNSPIYTTPQDACQQGWNQIRSQTPALATTTATYSGGECRLFQGSTFVQILPVEDTRIDPPRLVAVEADRDDGGTLRFNLNSNVFAAEPNVKLRLISANGGYQLTDSEDRVERYDSAGKLMSITDRDGVVQTLTYDSGGLIASVVDSFARTLSFGHDAQGRVLTIEDPAGGEHRYTYDATGNIATVRYPDGKIRSYLYEDSRFPKALTGITDENGDRFATWAYDAQGRATLSEHAGGADRVTLTYAADGSVTATDALGATRTHNFTGVFGLPRIAASQGDACGSCTRTTAITYDANGFVASRTDFNGNVTTYVHDARGLETSRTEAFGSPQARAITTQWHATFRLPLQIDEPGRRTTHTYDASGNRLSKTVSDTTAGISRTWAWTYNSTGQPLTMDGPRTDVSDLTTYEYDVQKNLIRITNALGQATEIPEHDAHGNPLRILDANGVETLLSYDARQRLKTRSIAGALTSFDYDGVGQMTRVTLPDGSFLTYTYDAAHRLTDIQDNLGNKIHYTLDALGNRTKEEVFDPASTLRKTQSQVFDALSRLKEMRGANGQVAEYGYDAQGNRTSDKQAGSFTTLSEFDALNRIKQVTDPANGVTQYGYNALDQLVSVTDPKNLVTTYSYNGLDDLNQLQSPDTGTTAYTYDSGGNRKTQTDARGVTVTYSYDALNRITKADYSGTAEDVIYQYDGSNYTPSASHGTGRLTGVTDESGQTTHFYDARGNLTQERRLIGGATYTTSYAYDFADRPIQITYPTGRIVNHQRDSLGRVTKITTTVGGITTTVADQITYLPFGGVASYILGNGVAVTRTHDLDYRLEAQKDQGSGVIRHVRTYYDPRNNIAATEDIAQPTRSQTFGYDALSRLNAADGSYGTYTYGYDATGNRTRETRNGVDDLYTYAASSHRLSSISGGRSASFSYDSAGSTTAKSGLSLTYNQAHRLASAGPVQSTYNAAGQRVLKTSGINSLVFHHDLQGHLIAETGSGAVLKREYVWLDDLPLSLDGIVKRLEAVTDNPEAVVTGSWAPATTPAGYLDDNYLSHAAAVPPGTVILDDLDTGATFSGLWTPFPGTGGHYGSTFFSNTLANLGARFTWTVPLSSPGRYRAYARWPAASHLATNAPFTVTHAGGSTLLRFNQRLNGGVWMDLGTFTFGSTAVISLGDNASAQVVADAVRLVPVETTGVSPDRVRWAAPDTQTYIVYARWPQSSSHSNQTLYSIKHATGTSDQNVSQQINGNQWNLLGTYSFTDTTTQGVTLYADPDRITAADAIRFVPTGASINQTVSAYFHTDHLNTSQKLTGPNQQVVWDAAYEPFGSTAVSINRVENPLRFPGQYADTEIGLFQNWHRDYDPINGGRYLQSDPIGLFGGLSTYGYAKQNPVSFVDPLGLATLVAIGAPTPSNPFGHVAIATTGSGIYSFGTATPFGSSATAYLLNQATYRNSTAYIINTSAQQEAAILASLKSRTDNLPPVPSLDSDDTCASRSNEALRKARLYDPSTPYSLFFSSPLPESSEAIGNFYGTGVPIPLGTTILPAILNQFNSP